MTCQIKAINLNENLSFFPTDNCERIYPDDIGAEKYQLKDFDSVTKTASLYVFLVWSLYLVDCLQEEEKKAPIKKQRNISFIYFMKYISSFMCINGLFRQWLMFKCSAITEHSVNIERFGYCSTKQ